MILALFHNASGVERNHNIANGEFDPLKILEDPLQRMSLRFVEFR